MARLIKRNNSLASLVGLETQESLHEGFVKPFPVKNFPFTHAGLQILGIDAQNTSAKIHWIQDTSTKSMEVEKL